MNLLIETADLATPLALVARRLNLLGSDALGDTFDHASFLAEAWIKLIGICLYAGINAKSKEAGYDIAYHLVRADSLGTWDAHIRRMTKQPLVSAMSQDFRPMVIWLSQARKDGQDQWFVSARNLMNRCLTELGCDETELLRERTVAGLISSLVFLRNKTKGHGAMPLEFYKAVNQDFISLLSIAITSTPMFQWRWLVVAKERGQYQFRALSGDRPHAVNSGEVGSNSVNSDGVYIQPYSASSLYSCGDLLRVDSLCSEFMVPNGGFNDKSLRAEFIDYGGGRTSKQDVRAFVRLPAASPESETRGMDRLDVQSNVFGNLPLTPKHYIERPLLQHALKKLLLDKNHPIITLHGPGGAGKTSLALFIAHQLADEDEPTFEHIAWLSARDVDLRDSGPVLVRSSITDLQSICCACARLFDIRSSEEDLQLLLQTPDSRSGKGTLFIFDNFETLGAPAQVYDFLNSWTHSPNKILITSRARSFKADFPIEVWGMELDEATKLIISTAQRLNVEGLLKPGLVEKIFEDTGGHAYFMRIVVGEIAKVGRYVSAKQLIGARTDIEDAILQRLFEDLTAHGRVVFLTVANWSLAVSSFALKAVLSARGIDVVAGIDECLKLSFVIESHLGSDDYSYSVPQVARLFARKKLRGDPDEIQIKQDLELLRHVQCAQNEPGALDSNQQIERVVKVWMQKATEDHEKIEIIDSVLECLARDWPKAWLHLARFRIWNNADVAKTQYALRRAVEELPLSKQALLLRAKYASKIEDEKVVVASLARASELDPDDVKLLNRTGDRIVRYIVRHEKDIRHAERTFYVRTVRAQLERHRENLSAYQLHTLCWLYLIEGDTERASQLADYSRTKFPNDSKKLPDRIYKAINTYVPSTDIEFTDASLLSEFELDFDEAESEVTNDN